MILHRGVKRSAVSSTPPVERPGPPIYVTFFINSVYYKYRARYLCPAAGVDDEKSHCSHHAYEMLAMHHRRLDSSRTHRGFGLR